MTTTHEDMTPLERAASLYADYQSITVVAEIGSLAALVREEEQEPRWYGAPAVGLVVSG